MCRGNPRLARHLQRQSTTCRLGLGGWLDLQATRPSALRSFSGLSAEERSHLRAWHADAKSSGIDGIEDLVGRAWPSPPEGTVIGVFCRGSDTARWLVIGQNVAWAVADCVEGTVSQAFQSLAEALATIYSGEEGVSQRPAGL